MRNLHENPRAIARVGLATTGSAVIEVDQDRQCIANDLVRFPAFDVNNKTDSAGIVFELRVIKSLFRRQSDLGHPFFTFPAHFTLRISSF